MAGVDKLMSVIIGADTDVNAGIMLNGWPVLLDCNLGKVAGNRTHKKKRINKKYRKRYGERFIPSGNCYVYDNHYGSKKVVMHPLTWEYVKRQFDYPEAK